MTKDVTGSEARVGRRGFLAGAGVLAGALALPKQSAAEGSALGAHKAIPAPRPIPGGADLGAAFGLVPPYDFIHFFAPGPAGQVLPFSGVVLEGIDTEPATITDFCGDVARAFLLGEAVAIGSDDVYDFEVDIGVMHGFYRATDGETHDGTFCLI